MNSNSCFFKNLNRIAHIALAATLSFHKWNSCPNIGRENLAPLTSDLLQEGCLV